MATAGINLSDFSFKSSSDLSKTKIAIVISEWNKEITNNLLSGVLSLLKEQEILETNIDIHWVPGTFELPLGCQVMCRKNEYDGIIAIGVVIQGETKHFDFVCQGATQGIMEVMLKYNTPVSFCVLTDNNIQQSLDRSGGKHGNKGVEAAVACLKMIELKNQYDTN